MLAVEIISWWLALGVIVCWWLLVTSVEGYEDERGFHYGKSGDINGERLGLASGSGAAEAANQDSASIPRDAA